MQQISYCVILPKYLLVDCWYIVIFQIYHIFISTLPTFDWSGEEMIFIILIIEHQRQCKQQQCLSRHARVIGIRCFFQNGENLFLFVRNHVADVCHSFCLRNELCFVKFILRDVKTTNNLIVEFDLFFAYHIIRFDQV